MTDRSSPTAISRTQSRHARCEILLVEDNPAHVRLFREGLAETGSEIVLRSVVDGEAAMHELKRRAMDPDSLLPDLALIDLQLPGRDGFELIEAIRSDQALRCLPVIVLTSSVASEDVTQCYESGANAYLAKPTQLDELISLVDVVERFWLEQARLPPGSC